MGSMLNLAAAVFGFFKGLLDRRREEAIRESGRLDQKTVDQQAAIDGQRRMEEAGAKPRESSQDAMDKGTF